MTEPSPPGHTRAPSARIARHPVSEDGVRKRVRLLSEDLPEAIAAARRNLIHCNSLKSEALAHAAQLLVLGAAPPEVCRSLLVGAEAVAAIFKGAMAGRGSIEVRIGEGPCVQVPSTVTPDLQDVGNWTDGFFMAATCRARDLLEFFCRVPVDLLRASTTRGLDDRYLFAEALQAYVLRAAGSADSALAALRAIRGDTVPPAAINATRDLGVPELELFLRLLEKEPGSFNESLARALEHHRSYWSQSDDLARDPRGYFSLSLTGLASLAHDAGIPITVESDYLPTGLVDGLAPGS